MLKRTILRLLAHLVVALFVVSTLTFSRAYANDIAQQALMDSSYYKWLLDFVVGVFGSFAGIAGAIFDKLIIEFVVEFGEQYKFSSLGFIIDDLWTTVRDIFNLTFIFGLIYIGFQIILGINDSAAKRTIGWLILAALLVNFSLFITKFVIDFSNIAAVQVYNLFESTDQTGVEDGLVNGTSISRAFVNSMEMSQIFATLPDGAELLYIFGVMIIFLILTYIFAAGAVLLAIRFASLCLYMVFSPIMFIGWVFPNMARYSSDFWRKFLGQAFFAPIFLFMLYLSYQATTPFNNPDLRDNLSNAAYDGGYGLTTPTEYVEVFAFLLLVSVFLIASMVVSKNLGAHGATSVMKIGDSMRKSLQGMAYRNTAGLALAGAVKGIDRLDRTAERGGVRGFGAKALRTAVGGETTRKVLDKGANYGAGGYGREDIKKMDKERKVRATTSNSEAEIGRAVKKGIRASATVEDKIAMERTIQDAPQSQLIETLKNADAKSYQQIVKAMSANQVTKLLDAKPDEFNDKEKAKLASTRSAQTMDRYGITDVFSGNIAKASVDDLVSLGYPVLLKHAKEIPGTKLDDLKSKLTPTELDEIKKKRSNELWTDFDAAPGSVFVGKKDKDIARLPDRILKDSRAVKFISGGALNNIFNDDTLPEGATDRRIIKDNFNRSPIAIRNASGWEWLNTTPGGRAF